MTLVLKKPTRGDTLLDFIHTNKEDLVWDAKLGGSLGCSNHKMEEFRILRTRKTTASSPKLEPTWTFSETCFKKNPMGYCPGEERGSGELTDIQASPPPSSRMVHADEEEIKAGE